MRRAGAPEAAVPVAHTLLPSLPDRGVVAVVQLPHAVGAARANAAATISDHRVQAEELRVVIVEVIELVGILGIVLRRLPQSAESRRPDESPAETCSVA